MHFVVQIGSVKLFLGTLGLGVAFVLQIDPAKCLSKFGYIHLLLALSLLCCLVYEVLCGELKCTNLLLMLGFNALLEVNELCLQSRHKHVALFSKGLSHIGLMLNVSLIDFVNECCLSQSFLSGKFVSELLFALGEAFLSGNFEG